MTDKDRLLALLSDFGLTPAEEMDPVRGSESIYWERPDDGDTVTLLSHFGNVGGYTGFRAAFYFNDDGSFDQVGVWE